MKFEVGKIYKLFWKSSPSKPKAIARCVSVDDPKIPGLRPVKLSVSRYFDDLNLYWFADLDDYAEEATEMELYEYAKNKKKEFTNCMKYGESIKRTYKNYEQLTLW